MIAAKPAAAIGKRAGCSAVLALEPVKNAIGGATLQALSEAEIGLMSVALKLVVMVAGSLAFPDKPKTEDEA